MSDEPTPEMIQLQQASDDAHQRVRELQERFGPPTRDGGWTEDQHAEWQALWEAWRDAATTVRSAVPQALEMAVKKAVRHPEPETEAA
ncbi:hypothetical protein OG785_45875 [Streptomyces sp. NBC_00006]|uniref:hypothetical protein n=1 Tax=Streptomyces sp. NBC_00006 TaxID=2975619 RepID=UPI002259BB05|nr:hypothetical protein [Streptomyces sp. NBC_00006]MCX5537698.1 hypothetical protein [Streptomyces sp. NBC_00006]MCX5537891.1 hypothetical protein [Streptomyces sp. NBC_00006]